MDHRDAEKYDQIALAKATVSWETGLPSRQGPARCSPISSSRHDQVGRIGHRAQARRRLQRRPGGVRRGDRRINAGMDHRAVAATR